MASHSVETNLSARSSGLSPQNAVVSPIASATSSQNTTNSHKERLENARATRGHRRTQSNLQSDFSDMRVVVAPPAVPVLTPEQLQNKQDFQKMLEVNRIVDANSTQAALANQKLEAGESKCLIVDTIDADLTASNNSNHSGSTSSSSLFNFGKNNQAKKNQRHHSDFGIPSTSKSIISLALPTPTSSTVTQTPAPIQQLTPSTCSSQTLPVQSPKIPPPATFDGHRTMNFSEFISAHKAAVPSGFDDDDEDEDDSVESIKRANNNKNSNNNNNDDEEEEEQDDFDSLFLTKYKKIKNKFNSLGTDLLSDGLSVIPELATDLITSTEFGASIQFKDPRQSNQNLSKQLADSAAVPATVQTNPASLNSVPIISTNITELASITLTPSNLISTLPSNNLSQDQKIIQSIPQQTNNKTTAILQDFSQTSIQPTAESFKKPQIIGQTGQIQTGSIPAPALYLKKDQTNSMEGGIKRIDEQSTYISNRENQNPLHAYNSSNTLPANYNTLPLWQTQQAQFQSTTSQNYQQFSKHPTTQSQTQHYHHHHHRAESSVALTSGTGNATQSQQERFPSSQPAQRNSVHEIITKPQIISNVSTVVATTPNQQPFMFDSSLFSSSSSNLQFSRQLPAAAVASAKDQIETSQVSMCSAKQRYSDFDEDQPSLIEVSQVQQQLMPALMSRQELELNQMTLKSNYESTTTNNLKDSSRQLQSDSKEHNTTSNKLLLQYQSVPNQSTVSSKNGSGSLDMKAAMKFPNTQANSSSQFSQAVSSMQQRLEMKIPEINRASEHQDAHSRRMSANINVSSLLSSAHSQSNSSFVNGMNTTTFSNGISSPIAAAQQLKESIHLQQQQQQQLNKAYQLVTKDNLLSKGNSSQSLLKLNTSGSTAAAAAAATQSNGSTKLVYTAIQSVPSQQTQQVNLKRRDGNLSGQIIGKESNSNSSIVQQIVPTTKRTGSAQLESSNLESRIYMLESKLLVLKSKTDTLEKTNQNLTQEISIITKERDSYKKENTETQARMLELVKSNRKNEENIELIFGMLKKSQRDYENLKCQQTHQNQNMDGSTNIFTDLSCIESPNDMTPPLSQSRVPLKQVYQQKNTNRIQGNEHQQSQEQKNSSSLLAYSKQPTSNNPIKDHRFAQTLYQTSRSDHQQQSPILSNQQPKYYNENSQFNSLLQQKKTQPKATATTVAAANTISYQSNPIQSHQQQFQQAIPSQAQAKITQLNNFIQPQMAAAASNRIQLYH